MDVLLFEHRARQPRRTLILVSHSFRLADHGLHADVLHEIAWRVSSSADPQTAVVALNCPTLRSSVVLAFPLSEPRTRLEVTLVLEIQPPALSGCLLTVLCLAAN